MFRKILVALDSSEHRQQVFSKALDIAKADQAELMLLHSLCHDDPSYPQVPITTSAGYFGAMEAQAFESFDQRWRLYEQKQLYLLKEQCESASTIGVKCESSLSKGSPGQMICNQAGAWQADLIVLGRRGYSGLKEIVLGSVSSYVMHHAPCSVLIVQ